MILILCLCLQASVISQPCPPGYTAYTRTYTVRDHFDPNKSCDWTLDMCVLCSASGPSADVIITAYHNTNFDKECILPNGDDILDKLMGDLRNLCEVPECGSGCLTLTVRTPTCWQYHYNVWYEAGVIHQYAWLVPGCNTGYCITTSGICYNSNTHSMIICSARSSTLSGVGCSNALEKPYIWPDGTPASSDTPWGPCYLSPCP